MKLSQNIIDKIEKREIKYTCCSNLRRPLVYKNCLRYYPNVDSICRLGDLSVYRIEFKNYSFLELWHISKVIKQYDVPSSGTVRGIIINEKTLFALLLRYKL